MTTIILDPGHGGRDPGAIGKRSKEKDNVLKVMLKVASILRGKGHKVVLTRDKDVYLSLTARPNIANKYVGKGKKAIFVSGHDNSFKTKSATGFETFIFNGNVSSKTKPLQNAIHDEIMKVLDIPDRGKKRANFAVLRQSKMPAVLIEYAFISNYNDETILINEVDKLATATANGILNHLGDSKVTSKPTSKPSKKPSKNKSNPKPGTKPTVRNVQLKINRYKINDIAVDNIKGPDTYQGLIKSYQYELNRLFDAGLIVDGLAGPKTDRAAPVLRLNYDKTNLNKLTQAMLILHGYDVKLDGYWQSESIEVLKQFQRDNNLTPDGEPGRLTYAKLIRF